MADGNNPTDSDETITLLSGEISIGTIDKAHAQLVEAFRAHRQVVGSVDPDANIDLSGVQLIESARRSALAAGGAFVLAEPAAGGLYETLRRGGFLETLDQRAFWLKTSEEQ